MLAALVSIFIYAHAEKPAAPFWKAKEKVYQRVKEGEIIVAVKSERGVEGEPKHKMDIQGGGHVKAPADFVFKSAQEYAEIAKTSGYIKSAQFDPATKTLAIEVSAYGYGGKMKLAMKTDGESDPKKIEYLVVDGPFRDMGGAFLFSNIPKDKCEVGISSLFRYDKLPVPQFFVEFGLEFVFQRMAGRLRSHVEDKFKKGRE